MRTGVIQYNLNQRGRALTGKPRRFNIERVAAFINGAQTQERIQKRDMFGYYGHWPRVKFGMMPPEGGIYQGKLVKLEPAISTVHLKAFPDDTIEHEEEFLATDAGRTAQKMFESKKGGFSSALSEVEGRFFGFDYVNEPNFDDNRGYVLDAATEDDGGAILDDAVIADYNQNLHGMLALLDSVQADHGRALAVIHRLQTENEQYLALLAGARVSLDSASSLPVAVSKQALDVIRADAAQFKQAILPGLVMSEQADDRAVSHHLWPVMLETTDVPAMNIDSDQKNLTILAIDLTLKETIPLFAAPKDGEAHDGQGDGTPDNPHGYPAVRQVAAHDLVTQVHSQVVAGIKTAH